MKKTFLLLGVMVAFASCNQTSEENTTDETTAEEIMTADMKAVAVITQKSESGVAGTVTFTQGSEGNEVMMDARISGLKPGSHAIHIHEYGDCSSDDGKSAGGHWNPTGMDHGKWGSDAYHKGDIGNLEADENGEVVMTMSTDEWCIGCEDSTKNILNRAIIIHEGADDFMTQPTGDAGGRVGCGTILESSMGE